LAFPFWLDGSDPHRMASATPEQAVDEAIARIKQFLSK
jgi:hypothetical protein